MIIAAVLLFLSSAAFALFNMTAVTMRQRLVPDGLLGRVTSLYRTVARGAEALGAIGGGALAATAGIRAPMLVGAVPIAALTAVLAWRHCRSAPGANSVLFLPNGQWCVPRAPPGPPVAVASSTTSPQLSHE